MHSNLKRIPRSLSVILTVALAGGCLVPPGIEAPAPEQIEHTLFLIGDAGEADPRADRGGIPLDSLTAQMAEAPERSTVVYLGDNVYPAGIPREGAAEWADARRRLAAQVWAVPAGARGIFIPGNHDWAHEQPDGLYSIREADRMITALAGGRDVRQLPPDGCPGPVTMDTGRLRLILLDTQWWLHPYIVRDSATECTATIASVTSELRREVRAPGEGRVVVVAAHHPLMTGGEHGGYCGVTGPFRRFAGRVQDVMAGANRGMRDSIEAAFSGAPPLVFAAGHDHSLQVLRGGKNVDYILVSGAGSTSKGSCAVRLRESEYTSPHRAGFMRLDIMRDRGVLLRVYRYTPSGGGGLSWSSWLEPRS